ncbi:MAG: hypothetical protein OIF36_03845 [Alphaproteobacteria bacterium]|nr:hypothetical protein [Alphaproteobacteria bacterium]
MTNGNLEDLQYIYIHFNLKDDSNDLNALDHVSAIKASNLILNEINKRIFKNKLEYELLVCPTEVGCHKIKMLVGSAFVLGVLQGEIVDFSKGFVKGLTGIELSSYIAGEKIGELLNDLWFSVFTKENGDLLRIDNNVGVMDKIIKLKSNFYLNELKNSNLDSIEYETKTNKKISRDDFVKHISEDQIKGLDPEYIIRKAVIIKPVDVNKDLVWELEDIVTKEGIKALLKDDDFKNKFLTGNAPLRNSNKDDVITILTEYKKEVVNGEIKKKEINIKKVYSLNDVVFSKIPSDLPENTKWSEAESLPMDEIWKLER